MIINLRERYSVRARAEVRDGRGVRPETFTEKFKIWGEVPREGTSRESEARSEDVLRLRVRYRTDIAIGDQLVSSGGTVYDIRATFDVDGLRRYLQLVVSISPGGQHD
jgi:SPP1 family predicted phage head-tail adaptor